MRWLDPASSYMRLVAIIQLMIVWQIVELNTFFIKHIFPMPAEHPICVTRILMTGLIAAPTIRQYYTYVTDPRCKRLGTQCWVFFMITFSELILSVKFGLDLFSHTQLSKMCLWFGGIVFMSCGCVILSHAIYKWRHAQSEDVDSPLEDDDDDKEIEFNQRTPYGLRKRAAHQVPKTEK